MQSSDQPNNSNYNRPFLSTIIVMMCALVFFTAEFTISTRSSFLADNSWSNIIYALGFFCHAMGFLAFPLSCRLLPNKDKQETFFHTIIPCASIAYIISFLVMIFSLDNSLFFSFALFAMFLLGYIGSFIYYKLSLMFYQSHHTGKCVGIGIAAATLVQHISQSYVFASLTFVVCLVASLALIGIILFLNSSLDMRQLNQIPKTVTVRKTPLLILVIVVSLMCVLLGSVDSIYTSLSTAGELPVFSYPKFFYIIGVLLAGFLADIKQRLYLPLITLITIAFATIILIFVPNIQQMSSSLFVMQFYIGFFVLFLSVSFLDIAPKTNFPQLWAGMGRVLRTLTAAVIALPALDLYEHFGRAMLIVSSILLALSLMLFFFVNKKAAQD